MKIPQSFVTVFVLAVSLVLFGSTAHGETLRKTPTKIIQKSPAIERAPQLLQPKPLIIKKRVFAVPSASSASVKKTKRLAKGALQKTIVVTGKNLAQVTKVEVILNDRPASDVSVVKLAPATATTREVTLEVGSNAGAGSYKLRLYTSDRRTIEVPISGQLVPAVGTLKIKQRSAPLDITIEKVGNQKVEEKTYQLDRDTGEIRFGDGKDGKVPLSGKSTIVDSYEFGGGSAGNVDSKPRAFVAPKPSLQEAKVLEGIRADSTMKRNMESSLSNTQLAGSGDGLAGFTSAVVSPDQWVIQGRVTDIQGIGVGALRVTAFDKDFINDDLLGSTVTDDDGYFRIRFKSEDFRDSSEQKPDIYLEVKDAEGDLLYSSKMAVRHNASQNEVFQITIRELSLSSKQLTGAGDGEHGRVPFSGKSTISDSYELGGGSAGNVDPNIKKTEQLSAINAADQALIMRLTTQKIALPSGLSSADRSKLDRTVKHIKQGDLTAAEQSWAELVPALLNKAIDINQLVQWVLRESYLMQLEHLKDYADRVRYFNEQKKKIRDQRSTARLARDDYNKDLEEDLALSNIDLQNKLQKQQQTIQMISQISKSLHDTAAAVTRKIGGGGDGLVFTPKSVSGVRLEMTGMRFEPKSVSGVRLEMTGMRFEPKVVSGVRLEMTGMRGDDIEMIEPILERRLVPTVDKTIERR